MKLKQMSDDVGLWGGCEVLLFLKMVPAISNKGVCLGPPTAFTMVVSV